MPKSVSKIILMSKIILPQCEVNPCSTEALLGLSQVPHRAPIVRSL